MHDGPMFQNTSRLLLYWVFLIGFPLVLIGSLILYSQPKPKHEALPNKKKHNSSIRGSFGHVLAITRRNEFYLNVNTIT